MTRKAKSIAANADALSPAVPITPPEPVAADELPTPERVTKSATVVALLRRADGATLAEVVAATGWLPHTTRAALTGLRKKGHVMNEANGTMRPATASRWRADDGRRRAADRTAGGADVGRPPE